MKCIICGMNTERSYADSGFMGVYCKSCASARGYISAQRRRPPNTGSNVQPPKPRHETIWAHNLEALKAFALGDPKDPETMLRYWKAQEAAGYPGASENVKYFTDIIESLKALHSSEREARWKGAGMGDYYCSLCQHTTSGRTKFCPECGAKMDGWEDTQP